MKYFIIATLICFLSPSSNAQTKTVNKQFVLTGKIIGQDSGYVHLSYWNSFDKYVHDSCYLKNGDFKFTGFINESIIAYFYGKRKSRSVDDPNSTDIFIEPTAMNAVFKAGDFKHSTITNSKTQKEYIIYTKNSDSLNKKWKIMWDAFYEARKKDDTIKANELLENQIPIYKIEANSMDCDFIKQYPNSSVSAYLLVGKSQRLTIDSLKMFYNLLSKNNQSSIYGKSTKEFIEKAEQLQIGKEAPDFTQADINGKSLSLKDFRGKYVLLEFWASWCSPCRDEHPYLKEAYSKYHEKGFNIIGISLNKSEEKSEWLDAIKQDELIWAQLCDFKYWGGEIVNKYNLYGRGIPSNFLIDPEGKLIARDLRGNSLEEKLNELIK